jgi:hypothetical protein
MEHADVELVDVVCLVVVIKVTVLVQVVRRLHVAEVFGEVLCLAFNKYLDKVLFVKIHRLYLLWLLNLVVVDVLQPDVDCCVVKCYHSLELL